MKEERSNWRSVARWVTGGLAVLGLFVAWYLTEFHAQAGVGDAVEGALCGAHDAVDCESALHSHYAEVFGIPIALLGVSFYAAVLMLVLFERPEIRASSDPFRPGAIAATTFGFGVVYSLFLGGVSAFELGSFCPYCAMLYGINGLGLVTACFWAGDKPHRLMVAQIRNPASFFNGWTGAFAFAFGAVLLAGTSVINAQIEERIADEYEASQAETAPIDVEPGEYRVDDAPAKGSEDAPVHVVEFSNFPCPFCAELAGSLDRLYDEYGDQVRVEFRHFPIANQQYGHLAARAGYCADEQGYFWQMHDALFANAPQHDRDSLYGYAQEIGLDEDRFSQCLDSDQARERVDEDIAAGQRLGVEGTPTFFINGQRFEGALPFEILEQIVEPALTP